MVRERLRRKPQLGRQCGHAGAMFAVAPHQIQVRPHVHIWIGSNTFDQLRNPLLINHCLRIGVQQVNVRLAKPVCGLVIDNPLPDISLSVAKMRWNLDARDRRQIGNGCDTQGVTRFSTALRQCHNPSHSYGLAKVHPTRGFRLQNLEDFATPHFPKFSHFFEKFSIFSKFAIHRR